MEKIMIMSKGDGTEKGLVRLVETLFSECEVCLVQPDSVDHPIRVGEQKPWREECL